MSESRIKSFLDTLADVQDDIRDFEAQRAAALQIALAPVQAELNAIEASFAEQLQHLRDTESEVQAAVKAAVLKHGESVKGSALHAVYAKGRTTWDAKLLDGYAVAHPEVNVFKKVGEPTVSIRAAKE
jgi:hypothetical protein